MDDDLIFSRVVHANCQVYINKLRALPHAYTDRIRYPVEQNSRRCCFKEIFKGKNGQRKMGKKGKVKEVPLLIGKAFIIDNDIHTLGVGGSINYLYSFTFSYMVAF